MVNNLINFKHLREEVDKRNQQIAKMLNNDMFKDITEYEWDTLLEAKNGPILAIITKIQDCIYNHHVSELVGKLHISAYQNKDVDAGIYGGLLQGCYESHIENILNEGAKRQAKRKSEKE